jgi:hypothetical protein
LHVGKHTNINYQEGTKHYIQEIQGICSYVLLGEYNKSTLLEDDVTHLAAHHQRINKKDTEKRESQLATWRSQQVLVLFHMFLNTNKFLSPPPSIISDSYLKYHLAHFLI